MIILIPGILVDRIVVPRNYFYTNHWCESKLGRAMVRLVGR
jgi:hypothetical protein